MSPVNDTYRKAGLAPAEQRVEMCRLAAQDLPLIMVDDWEAAQLEAQRSLHVLRRVSSALQVCVVLLLLKTCSHDR